MLANGMNTKQASLGISVLLIFMCTYYFTGISRDLHVELNFLCDDKNLSCDTEEIYHQPNDSYMNMSEKWIIITTISYPTEDIKQMAKMDDWQIVIVADKKTPKEWFMEGCIFLSLETQKRLHYEISRILPYQSYTRKMIGYLYAIEHGAKYIYDTDDDNLPIESGLNGFVYSNVTSGLILHSFHKSSENETAFYNVYSHFGHSDVWPRGFPLDKINDNIDVNYKLCEQVKTPAIQQGLVNQDADVDAIYRLLYIKNKSKGLRISFNSYAPPIILPKKVYCPFNSQDTLFHYEAFWALMLPTTVTFRVTDIWRGYWAQRLLHLTDNRLGFYPPNARQNRNPHNYLKDFSEETQLYTETTKLVEAIEKWQCKSKRFENCVLELSEFMSTNNFWGPNDLKLTQAWINDLINIGYKFPEIGKWKPSKNCRNTNFLSPIEKDSSSRSCLKDNWSKVKSFCHPFFNESMSPNFQKVTFNHTKNVVLTVAINWRNYMQIPLLRLLYEPFFASVVFCATFPENLTELSVNANFFQSLWTGEDGKFSFVNLHAKEMNNGGFHYACLSKVAQMEFQNIDGYLVIADDMLLNFWNPYHTDKIVFPLDCTTPANKSHWWWGENGLAALKKFHQYLNSNSFDQSTDNESLIIYDQLKDIVLKPMHCISDIYYVPHLSIKKYQTLAELFAKHEVFVELAVPKILYLLGWAHNETLDLDKVHTTADEDTIFKGRYLWNYGPSRGDTVSFNSYNSYLTFLHPVKWTFANKTEWRKAFCTSYVASWMKNAFYN